MKKAIVAILMMAMVMVSVFAGGSKEDSSLDNVVPTEVTVTSLKIGTTAPPTTLVSQSAAMFGEKLKELSGGQMSIELCTSGTLGTTAQHYSQLEQGVLDMFVTAFDTETAMKDSKDFSVFVVPYAFDDNAHLRRFLETDRWNEMLSKVEKANRVVEHYKNVAHAAVNRYIESKAKMYGVKPVDITNRLTENYSFKDIDQVCEQLGKSQLKIGALPFSVRDNGKTMKVQVKESKEPIKPRVSGFDDDIGHIGREQ